MNYNIVVDASNFKPYDYNLAWKAIDDYNTGYEKSLAVYDKIAQTLGDLAGAVEGTTVAKGIYDNYQNQFNEIANQFYKNGMNINTAKGLGNLRQLYGTLIRQLEKANEAMVKEAERRRAERDPSMLYESIGTLDDYLKNPNRTLGSYSGNKLTEQVGKVSKSLGLSLAQAAKYGQLDLVTKLWLETTGFNPIGVDKAVALVRAGGIDAVSDPVYRNIIQSVMLSSGVYNWADENVKRQAELKAAEGLYEGIGKSTMHTYEDKIAIENYKHQQALELLRAKNELDFNNSLGGTYGRSYLDEVDENGNTKYLNLLTQILSLIGEDGNIKKEYMAALGALDMTQDPMTIYREYNLYAKDHHKIAYSGNPHLTVINYVPDYEEAAKYIKNKYKVLAILTPEQYEALETLGYNRNAFAVNLEGSPYYNIKDYMDKLDNLASRKTTSYASGEKITQAIAKRIGKGLSHYSSDNALKEVDGQLQTVDPADWDAITPEDINEVGIDIGAKKVVFVTKKGTKYAVDPNIISKDFLNKWNTGMRLKQQIEQSNYTNAEKAKALYELQETVLTWLMKECGRDIFQVKSETSNDE